MRKGSQGQEILLADSWREDQCSAVNNAKVLKLGDDSKVGVIATVVETALISSNVSLHCLSGPPLALSMFIKAQVESYGYLTILRVMQCFVNA